MSENPEIFVGIDIAKDMLDIGFQPSGQTVRLPHDAQGIRRIVHNLHSPNAGSVRQLVRPLGSEARGGSVGRRTVFSD